MKRIFALLVPLGCALGQSESDFPPARAVGILDIDAPIVARVGDEFVTGGDLKRAIATDPALAMLESLRRKAALEGTWDLEKQEDYERKAEAGKKRVALQVVMMHLLAQEAARRGLQADDSDVERRLQRALSKSDDLARRGYSIDELRAQIRRSVMAETLERSDRAGTVSTPSPTRVRKFYEDHSEEILRPDCVRLRIIRIARTKEDPVLGTIEVPEAERKAERIAGQVSLEPDSFARLASRYSEHPETAEKGGLLIYESAWGATDLVPRKVLPVWLRETVNGLEPGQISPVVGTPDSYYVVKLEAATPPERLSFEDAQETIINILQRQDDVLARDEWLRRMASRAVVTDGLGRQLDLESLYVKIEEQWTGRSESPEEPEQEEAPPQG